MFRKERRGVSTGRGIIDDCVCASSGGTDGSHGCIIYGEYTASGVLPLALDTQTH